MTDMFVILFTVLSVFCGILAIAGRVLLALAVNFDCRARNLKATTLFTVLMVFFPVIVGIVYACVRDTAEPNEKYCAACNLRFDGSAKMCPSCNSYSLLPVLKPESKKWAKTGVTLCIIGVIVFALCFGCGVARTAIGVKAGTDIAKNFSEEEIEQNVDDFLKDYLKEKDDTTTATTDGEEDTTDFNDVLEGLTYYDREGKSYDSAEKVPFYDRDGNVYLCAKDENYSTYFYREGTDEKLDFKKCFVDKDGYFIYDDKGAITLSEDGFSATDKDGNDYAPAALVIWNKDGTMISSIN